MTGCSKAIDSMDEVPLQLETFLERREGGGSLHTVHAKLDCGGGGRGRRQWAGVPEGGLCVFDQQ